MNKVNIIGKQISTKKIIIGFLGVLIVIGVLGLGLYLMMDKDDDASVSENQKADEESTEDSDVELNNQICKSDILGLRLSAPGNWNCDEQVANNESAELKLEKQELIIMIGNTNLVGVQGGARDVLFYENDKVKIDKYFDAENNVEIVGFVKDPGNPVDSNRSYRLNDIGVSIQISYKGMDTRELPQDWMEEIKAILDSLEVIESIEATSNEEDGDHWVKVDDLFTKDGVSYMDVDYLQYFIGREALLLAISDGDCSYEGFEEQYAEIKKLNNATKISDYKLYQRCFPNDTAYIKNENSKIREFEISDNVKIITVTDSEMEVPFDVFWEVFTKPWDETIKLSEQYNYFGPDGNIKIIVEGGKVVKIEHYYVP